MCKKSVKSILKTYNYLTDGNKGIIGEVTYKYIENKNIKFFRFDTRFLKKIITLGSKGTRDINIALVPYKCNKDIALFCVEIPE